MSAPRSSAESSEHPTSTSLPGLKGFLGPRDYDALTKCVHCGLCLNACPTYRQLGIEPDSPRGRLYLIRAVAEGELPVTDEVARHLNLCLVCRACETACPSGVQFGQVMEAARSELLEHHATPGRKLLTWLVFRQLFPHPGRLRLLGVALRLYQRIGLQRLFRLAAQRLPIPRRLVLMEQMLPPLSDRFFEAPPSEVVPAEGERRFRVGMISGCIMPLAFAPTDEATARVLAANGCEVLIPKAQVCCAALHSHSGDRAAAQALARRNIVAFEQAGLSEIDAVIINAAGCGAQLKGYGQLLEEDPEYEERARNFAGKVEDVTEFLARVGLTAPLARIERRVTYQDPCHLVHGQRIREQPRQLLRAIPGLDFVEMLDSDRCCGSAGIYNIVQSEMSMDILDEKMADVLATRADQVVTANPGCILQLNLGQQRFGQPANAIHIVDLLDEAIAEGNRAAVVSQPSATGSVAGPTGSRA